jgi:hypothetical protein
MAIPEGSNIYSKRNSQLKYDSGGIEHYLNVGSDKRICDPSGINITGSYLFSINM